MDYAKESLRLHSEWKGKIKVTTSVPLENATDLSLAYTPGVAAPCLAIEKDYSKSFELTRRGNLIAVITDGTAVLGLGDIGPEAAMPVMEGKCAIFNKFGGVEAFPICLRTKNVDEIVETIYRISGSFGGINLEDISAPRCFEVEERLKKMCDIPIFHDDQHGTAIVTGAALLNALKLAGKKIGEIKIVMSGAGSAGIAIAKLLLELGVKNIIMCDRQGVIFEGRAGLDDSKSAIALITNREKVQGSLADAMKGADVFIGVSSKNCVTPEMVKSMANKSIIFPMANPDPEIAYDLAIEAGAFIVGTGRSDYPNQINNAIAFPGIFRGALDVRATDINNEMKIAATYAIANSIDEKDLNTKNIIPKPFDLSVHKNIAEAVKKAAIETKINRI